MACCLSVLPLRWHLPKVSDLMLCTWRVNGISYDARSKVSMYSTSFHYLTSQSLWAQHQFLLHAWGLQQACLPKCQIQRNAAIAVQASCHLVQPGTIPSIWSAYITKPSRLARLQVVHVYASLRNVSTVWDFSSFLSGMCPSESWPWNYSLKTLGARESFRCVSVPFGLWKSIFWGAGEYQMQLKDAIDAIAIELFPYFPFAVRRELELFLRTTYRTYRYLYQNRFHKVTRFRRTSQSCHLHQW